MEAAPQGALQRHLHQQAAGGFSDPPSPLQPPLSPASAAAAALANARWTPTMEQIAVLEGLYRQGLRTPTAEQIQQITARLREHGHIEGKNVFYWFQNHKARQRQKQKQQSFDYFSKLLRRPPPLPVLHRPLVRPIPLPMPAPAMPSSACNTGGVMYRTESFMPAAPPATATAGYFSQQQQVTPVLYPGLEVVSPPHYKVSEQPRANALYPTAPPNSAHFTPLQGRGAGRETLQLFPLQSTFVLPDSKVRRGGGGGGDGSGCAVSLSAPAPSFSGELARSSDDDSPNNSEAPPFYDFFGVHSGGR
ncbi:hypothetical protein GUJ93_ZPchr0001g31705 [Zizania palustris]|uniref:Homeobox domain-containing protein n=1 Tax=Zizania palustris TaxID=103762 RepID=A0A8J5VPA2_ZIZPA|nr:hypothetical protein GUJ93_ZPchr0001g31705 [Zizania palustris]